MRTILRSLALGVAALTFVATPQLAAQAADFDARAFFDKAQAEGRSFDAKTFFDRLQAEGRTSLDAKALFDKLQAEGRSNDKDFDPKKLWQRLEAEARSSPATATMIGAAPSKADCSQGWAPGGRWDQPVFNTLCATAK